MADKPKKPTSLRLVPSGKKLSDVAELVTLMSVLISTLFVHLVTERPQFSREFLASLRAGLELDATGKLALSDDFRRAYTKAIQLIEDMSR